MYEVKDPREVRDMANGAVFLGSGGGGDPYVGELFLVRQLAAGKYPRIVKASELDDDAFVVSIAGIGAPTVLVEHMVSETMLMRLVDRAQQFYGKKIDALISAEIGGANSMFPLAVGAKADIPVVDADGMGRAFPHVEMTTFSVYGCTACPAIFTDEFENWGMFDLPSDRTAEDVLRAFAVSLGAMVVGAIYPMTGKDVKRFAVHDTITQTIDIGRCIRLAREQGDRPIDRILAFLCDPTNDRYAKLLFEGKIVDIRHETRDGWHWGEARIVSLNNPSDELVIDIQNEYLSARRNGRTVAIVPDLIAVLDRETCEPMTAETLRYGLRVQVVGYSAAPIMRREKCLAVFGPRMFGYDEDFRSLADLNDDS
jgi:hypothetical protein